jgi:hypothetical protein
MPLWMRHSKLERGGQRISSCGIPISRRTSPWTAHERGARHGRLPPAWRSRSETDSRRRCRSAPRVWVALRSDTRLVHYDAVDTSGRVTQTPVGPSQLTT